MKRNLLLLAASVTAAMVLLETAVRILLPYNTPDTVRKNSLQYRPTVFAIHMLQANQQVDPGRAWGQPSSPEVLPSRLATNGQGYRGSAIDPHKPDGTCRIVIPGGSAVFDPRADEGHDWPRLLEDHLKRKGVKSVEVVNAGVPAHASFDSVGRLFSQLWIFQPDYVLFYNAWNDIKYWTEMSIDRPLLDILQPYNPLDDPFRYYRNPLDRLLAKSQVYVKLRNRYFIWTTTIGAEGKVRSEELSDTYSNIGPGQYRLGVELFVDAVRAMGATPVLMTQATLVSPGNSAEEISRISLEYASLTHRALHQAFKECSSIVRSVAIEKEVDLLDLDSMFSGDSLILADHVHLTSRGGKELAEAIARFLVHEMRVCQ